MKICYGPMKPGQEHEVAALIRALVDAYGVSFEARVSAAAIRSAADFLNVEVAETDGEVIGACAWVMTFSTWRGMKGMYVADLVIRREDWNLATARSLLRSAARAGARQGAGFIRLESDISDENAETLYAETGFTRQQRHDLYYLEQKAFAKFTESSETAPAGA